MKRISATTKVVTAIAGTVGAALLPARLVLASAKDDILTSVNSTDPGGPTVDNALGAAINVFGIIIGFVAVIMMMVGGYKYITSSGDANKAAQAKSTILYALIGAALVIVSQVLLRFVIAKGRGL
jgi:hypothetical protein